MARMELFWKFSRDRRVRWGLAFLLVAVLAATWEAWNLGLNLAAVKALWKQCDTYLASHPGVLFLAIVFLPGLPIPTSALLFTAGVVWRQHPVMACLLCLLAMTLNLAWTYWLAAGPARRLVERLLVATAFKIPELPRGDHLKLILILKLTPGIPFFVQNYLCGFLRAPFWLYLSISILCNGILGTGVVLSGVGLADGKLMPALTGISLIVVAVVFTHLVRGWLARKKERVVGEGDGAGFPGSN